MDIPTGYSVEENKWNYRTNNLKDSYPDYNIVSPILEELKAHWFLW
jgi:hypothetical protein